MSPRGYEAEPLTPNEWHLRAVPELPATLRRVGTEDGLIWNVQQQSEIRPSLEDLPPSLYIAETSYRRSDGADVRDVRYFVVSGRSIVRLGDDLGKAFAAAVRAVT